MSNVQRVKVAFPVPRRLFQKPEPTRKVCACGKEFMAEYSWHRECTKCKVQPKEGGL